MLISDKVAILLWKKKIYMHGDSIESKQHMIFFTKENFYFLFSA